MPHSHSQPHPDPFLPFRGARRVSGAERSFSDADGRSWAAVSFPMPAGRATGDELAPGSAVVFSCVSDARLAQRATGVPAGVQLVNVPDGTLRNWLAHAPLLGRLS